MTPAPRERPTLRELLTDWLGRVSIRSAQILVILALAAVTVWALTRIPLVVIPLLIALILAAAIGPVVNWLRSRGMPAILATWLTFLAILAVLAGIITLITIAVRNQWDDLVASAAAGLEQLQDYLANGPFDIDQEQITEVRDTIIDFLTTAEFGTGAIAGVTTAIEIGAGAILVVVILFFFLKDGEKIWNFFLQPFEGERLARARRIGKTGLTVLGGYVRGTAIVAFVDAVAIGIGLFILGVPLALPLAVIVFITAFIPLVGATLAGILAALVALVANGPLVALIVIIIVIAVNQLEGDLLQPIVMSQSLKLHPLVILVALTAGTVLGGIAGAVLAVPLTALGWSIVKVWKEPGEDPVRAVPAEE